MQSASSRIWTHVTVSISYDNNHYTSDTLVRGKYVCIEHETDPRIHFHSSRPVLHSKN